MYWTSLPRRSVISITTEHGSLYQMRQWIRSWSRSNPYSPETWYYTPYFIQTFAPGQEGLPWWKALFIYGIFQEKGGECMTDEQKYNPKPKREKSKKDVCAGLYADVWGIVGTGREGNGRYEGEKYGKGNLFPERYAEKGVLLSPWNFYSTLCFCRKCQKKLLFFQPFLFSSAAYAPSW